jgi:hypothetical protein
VTSPETGNEDEKRALGVYLYAYLVYLQAARRHVLYSLPDYGDISQRISIDFSEASNTTLKLQEIRGVSVNDINAQLSASWAKAHAPAKEGVSGEADTILSLSEYRSTSNSQTNDDGMHFQIKYGAPSVEGLCDDEALMYLNIEEASFYKTKDFTQ